MILCGDSLEVLKTLDDNSVDSVVTDPPYGLSFMGKHWDYDVPQVELWQEVFRVLKPGGHLLAFAGTRTQHRMAVNIEDAGFEIRDMIMYVYGSGFPKSLNIGKAVDKLQGGERELVTSYRTGEGANFKYSGNGKEQKHLATAKEIAVTKGNSPWEGWGTALKPALEPITVARKPLEGTVANNVLKYGTGGLNIDQSRVKSDYCLQGSDLNSIISICQLNHLLLPANNVELKRFQDDTTNAIKSLYSVLETADMPTTEKIPGTQQEDTVKKATSCSDETSTANTNTSLSISGSGSERTAKNQRDTKYITSTVSKMITDWKISSLSVSQLTEVLLTQARKLKATNAVQGRFPSNLIHDGSDEVVGLFPDTKSGGGQKNRLSNQWVEAGRKGIEYKDAKDYSADSGSAARFFYCAKSSRSERNKGLDRTVSIDIQLEQCENDTTNLVRLARLLVVTDNSLLKATAEFGIGTKSGTEWSMSLFGKQYMGKYLTSIKSTTETETSSITTSQILSYLTGLLTNESTLGANLEMENGGSHVNGVESSNTLIATISDQTALALGVNPAQASNRLLISVKEGSNFHSTVKPVKLMQYLVRLVTPKGGTVLDPFTGSGTTGIACKLEGMEFVGIEREQEYVDIAQARIEAWEPDKQESLL